MSNVSPADSAELPRVLMVQDGARRRYALPIALHHAGMLERMFTDWFVRPGSKELLIANLLNRLKPTLGRSLLGRQCLAIPPDKVVQSARLTLRLRRAERRFPQIEQYYAWAAEETGRWIIRHGLGNANILLGFVRNLSPELCKYAREHGLATVADQIIAPAAIEQREWQLQNERWPAWEPAQRMPDFAIVRQIEEQTWRELSHITCMSDYVRQGLLEQGIAAERITTIPYPIDASTIPYVDRRGRTGPLTVGFIGAVGLRKGVPYILEVAKRFDPAKVRFVLVGNIGLSDLAQAEFRTRAELAGPVSRSQITQWLERFDVFLFPSSCEGSAGAVMEAMASGLPVITSPNSGSLVRHGLDGYITKYDDVEGMAGYLDGLANDADLRDAMGRSARACIEQSNLEQYGRTLAELMWKLVRPA